MLAKFVKGAGGTCLGMRDTRPLSVEKFWAQSTGNGALRFNQRRFVIFTLLYDRNLQPGI